MLTERRMGRVRKFFDHLFFKKGGEVKGEKPLGTAFLFENFFFAPAFRKEKVAKGEMLRKTDSYAGGYLFISVIVYKAAAQNYVTLVGSEGS